MSDKENNKAFGRHSIASSKHHLAASSPRVRSVYRSLLHYIYLNELKPGDLLPGHEVLRKSLRTGSITLHDSISMLVQDGVLERVRGTGTRLIRTDIISQQTWTVGVAVLDELTYGFRPMLEHYMRRALIQNGCSDRSYLSLPEVPEDKPLLKPDDFAGLPEDIEAKKVDAILSFKRLETDKVPVCCVGGGYQSISGMSVQIDDATFITEACKALRERGYRSIAIFGPQKYNTSRKKHLKAKKVPCAGIIWIEQASSGGIESGVKGAADFMMLNQQSPIDAIITLDETLANTLVQILRSQGYRPPAMAIQINKQIPTPLIGPDILRFEVDIKELADRSAQMVSQQLLDPDAVIESAQIAPKLIDG